MENNFRKIEEDKEKTLCPLCKLSVDERDEENLKMNLTRQLPDRYPDWAYMNKGADKEGNMIDHLINFHRLPKILVEGITLGVAIGGFLKDHPNFEVGVPTGE